MCKHKGNYYLASWFEVFSKTYKIGILLLKTDMVVKYPQHFKTWCYVYGSV